MAGNKLTAGTNNLLAVIGDEETVVGMLLAGVGNVDGRKSSNFFVVDDASAWRRQLQLRDHGGEGQGAYGVKYEGADKEPRQELGALSDEPDGHRDACN